MYPEDITLSWRLRPLGHLSDESTDDSMKGSPWWSLLYVQQTVQPSASTTSNQGNAFLQ
jgi:hypothetical protein